jgi:hypothetical protein
MATERERPHQVEVVDSRLSRSAVPPVFRQEDTMPTVRLRDAAEYPDAAQALFALSKTWFDYDFREPPAMSRVMAWDPQFGGPHGRAMKRAMTPGEFTRAEKEMVAAAVSGANACQY